MSSVTSRVVRPRAISLLATGLAGSAFLALSPAAFAGSWEQVSRSNGAQGSALFSNQSAPVFASDSGRFSLVQSRAYFDGDETSSGPTNLRDIVANTTRTIASPVTGVFHERSERVRGVDAAETTALVERPAAGGTTYVLRPLSGGAGTVVAKRTDSASFRQAALSGDGKTVAYVSDDGITVVDVPTKRKTVVPDSRFFDVASLSLSDDGTIITGRDREGDRGFVIKGGTIERLPDEAFVSPDGSTIATWDASAADPHTVLALRNVATGVVTKRALPAGAGYSRIAWISPDGRRVAAVSDGEAVVVNTVTGASAPFGGAYGGSLRVGGIWNSAISRNGRYAVIDYAAANPVQSGNGAYVSQAALVDLTGADLPGSQEALSASSYLKVTPPIADGCSQPATLKAVFGQPATWAPTPRTGEITVTADGKQAFHKTYAAPSSAVTLITLPASAKSVTTTVKVIDDKGRALTSQQTIAARCYEDRPF